MNKNSIEYVEKKNLAYSILREAFPKSNIYVVNKELIIIDGDRYNLCKETQYFIVKNEENCLIFDQSTLAIQKAFRVLRGNALYSNL